MPVDRGGEPVHHQAAEGQCQTEGQEGQEPIAELFLPLG